MELSLKLAVYFLIISSELDFAMSRPPPTISNEMNSPTTDLKRASRKRRQVVQPTWLSNGGFFPIDTKVRVTEQSLKEAAEIRKSIQSAVDAGTFAIDVSQPTPVIPVSETSEDAPTPQPMFPSFDFGMFDFSKWNANMFGSAQPNAFAEQMTRMWQEFVDNSKKWLNFSNA